MNKLFFNFFLMIGLFTYSLHSTATQQEQHFESVSNHFEKLVNTINQTVLSRQKEFEAKPKLLVDYVDKTLIPLWSSSKTLSGFLSRKSWKKLTIDQQKKLVQSFNNTLQRYVQEGFKSYDGQQIEFVKVRLSDSKKRGVLTLKVIPNLVPSFNIDLKIQYKHNRWQIYDVLLQGISYVSIKKDEFRKAYLNQGFDAVALIFDNKNKGFVPSSAKISL